VRKAEVISINFYLSLAGFILFLGVSELGGFVNLELSTLGKILYQATLPPLFLAIILLFLLTKFVFKTDANTSNDKKLFNKISIAIIALSCVAGAVVGIRNITNAVTPLTEEQKIELEEKTKAQEEATQKINAIIERQKLIDSLRFAQTVSVLKVIKKNLREPDSLVIETVLTNENATVVCAEYRAKNGFGGMTREFIVYANKNLSQSAEVWNKHCLKEMFDMKSAKYGID